MKSDSSPQEYHCLYKYDLCNTLTSFTPDVLNYLLPSDVCRLSATNTQLRRFFNGEPKLNFDASSAAQTLSLDDSASLGEVWWRNRCVNRLSVPVVSIAFNLDCSTWNGAYSQLRRRFNCRVGVRLKRPAELEMVEDHTLDTWVNIKAEELEEAALSRFFSQCDFYRHQLTPTFVLHFNLSRNGLPPRLRHLNRQSFTSPPPREYHQFLQPLESSKLPEKSPLTQGVSLLCRRREPSTDIVLWCPGEPALLPYPSSVFPDTVSHQIKFHQGSPEAKLNETKRRYQTRLSLRPRAHLIQLHSYVAARLMTNPLTSNLTLGPMRQLTPPRLFSLSYSLLVSNEKRHCKPDDCPLTKSQWSDLCTAVEDASNEFSDRYDLQTSPNRTPPHSPSVTPSMLDLVVEDPTLTRLKETLISAIINFEQKSQICWPINKVTISVSSGSPDQILSDDKLPVAFSQETFHLIMS